MDGRLQRIQRELLLAGFGVETGELSAWVLDRLTLILEERQIRRGDVMWRAGEPIEHLYFMHGGRVQLVREGAPPWTFDGRWFLGGFEGHLDRAARTAVAAADFQALAVPRRAWLDLLEDSFELTRRGVLASSGALARLDERVSGSVLGPEVTPAAAPLNAKLDTLARLSMLTDLELARGAGVQALGDLAAVSHPLALAAGDQLLRVGDPHTHLYLIVAGAVEARRGSPDVTKSYGAGEIVGGPAAFSKRIEQWEAHSRTPTILLAIPLDAWFDLMEEHFGLALSLFRQFTAWRERLLDQLAAVAGPEGLILT
jgi:CRP-like cAMP-binding protein